LATYIQRNAEEVTILDEEAFKKCAQKVTARDQSYLDDMRNLRSGFFTVQRQLRQIIQVLDGRADHATTTDKELPKQWRKMRKNCLQVSQDAECALEPVRETINDYHHAFPNEKSTFLKKLGQVSAVASIATVLSSYFFGDDAKTKAIATGSSFVIGTVIVNMERAKDRTAPRRPLEAAAIRQVYAYLS
jgi:Mg2+ and Co2+ transporter CorA